MKKILVSILYFSILLSSLNVLAINYQLINGIAIQYNVPFDSIALENEYVKIMRNSIIHDETKSNFGFRVIVALTKVKINCLEGKFKLKRGDVKVFTEKESYEISSGEYFEVNFKKIHPAVKFPETWIEPVKNKIIHENAQFRIFEERLAPGDTRELHSHAQRIVVRLNNVQLTDPRKYPNGQPGGGIQVPSTVKFAEPIVHVVKNLSDIPLFNIVIELKK